MKIENREGDHYPSIDLQTARNFLAQVAERDGDNPLFADPIYQLAIAEALQSPCQKMGFGAVLVRDGVVVASANNTTIEGLDHLCPPDGCIRNNIQSRTESMIGACGHAEEWVMKKGRDLGIDLTECEMYVAGVKGDGTPYIKQVAEHTCLRCCVQQNYAGIKGIVVPVVDHWETLTPQEALRTAAEFATGKKRV